MTAQQGTPEWFAERIGYCTASKFSSVIARGEGKSRKTYLTQLVCERLNNKATEGFSSKHTDRGIEQEPYARMAYEARTSRLIEESGFIKHDSLKAGASPDGLVGSDGGVEIKCVIEEVQIETILRGCFPAKHNAQIQGCMWITNREWWDFISFSPAMRESLQLCIYRVWRDQPCIDVIERDVARFMKEVDETVARLENFSMEDL